MTPPPDDPRRPPRGPGDPDAERLRALERSLELDPGDLDTWSQLAVLATRMGRVPRSLDHKRAVRRVLDLVVDAPDRAELRTLLEMLLPVEVPHDPTPGPPAVLVLRPGGQRLRRVPGKLEWEGEETLLDLPPGGHPLDGPRPEDVWGSHRSLRWYRAASFAHHLLQEARSAGTLHPAWELGLRRRPGKRHLVPEDSLRLSLRPTRRLRPPPPRVETERILGAWSASGFRQGLLFFPDGRFWFANGNGNAGLRRRLLDERAPDLRGRWTLEGRALTMTGRGRHFDGEWRGFVGEDQALNLTSKSLTTDYHSANLWKPIRS